MIEKIKKNVWLMSFKNFGRHVYLIKIKKDNILVDTSSILNKKELLQSLKELELKPEDITKIILTHCHWDHTGGINLFPNAKFYGNRKDFGRNLINPKRTGLKDFKIIKTPGHSKGSICILYKDILFSGDTLFHRGTIGLTSIPGGSKKEMQKSLKKLEKIKYKILAPGHGRP